MIVYFSSVSETTKNFVERLGMPNLRIPLSASSEPLLVYEPYVLITPSYGAGNIKNAVPKQVIKFLNNEQNRSFIRGVIASGNTNYGNAYCIAGRIISEKTNVPLLYQYELLGLPEDVENVKKGLTEFWNTYSAQAPSTQN